MFTDKKSQCIRVQFHSFLHSKLMFTAQNWEIFLWFLRPPEPEAGACVWNVAKSMCIDLSTKANPMSEPIRINLYLC